MSRIARLVRPEVFLFVRPKLFPAGSDQNDGPFGNHSVNFFPFQKILFGDQVIGMPLGFVTHIYHNPRRDEATQGNFVHPPPPFGEMSRSVYVSTAMFGSAEIVGFVPKSGFRFPFMDLIQLKRTAGRPVNSRLVKGMGQVDVAWFRPGEGGLGSNRAIGRTGYSAEPDRRSA